MSSFGREFALAVGSGILLLQGARSLDAASPAHLPPSSPPLVPDSWPDRRNGPVANGAGTESRKEQVRLADQVIPDTLIVKFRDTIEMHSMDGIHPLSIDSLDTQSLLLAELTSLGGQKLTPLFAENALSSFSDKDRNSLSRWFRLTLIPSSAPDATALGTILQTHQQLYGQKSSLQMLSPDFLFSPDGDPIAFDVSNAQWHLKDIGLPESDSNARDPKEAKQPILVAELDSGVASSIKIGNQIVAPVTLYINEGEIPNDGIDNDGNGVVDDVSGANFTVGVPNGNTTDDSGHGTAVGATAFAHPDTGLKAVASNVQIVPVKVCESDRFGSICTASSVAQGIAYALGLAQKEGRHVVMNMSIGGPRGSPLVEELIKIAWKKGAILVASAGNDGQDLDQFPHYPASYEDVIAAGGSGFNRQRDRQSNFGTKVIYAPDGPLVTLMPKVEENPFAYSPSLRGLAGLPDAFAVNATGTSFSSPQVAATAARVWSQYPMLSNRDVGKILHASTIDGIVHVGKALQIAKTVANGESEFSNTQEPLVPFSELPSFTHLYGNVKLEAALSGEIRSVNWSIDVRPFFQTGLDQEIWQHIITKNSTRLSHDFDTSTLPTGWYTLKISAQDRTGMQELTRVILVNNDVVPLGKTFPGGCYISSPTLGSDPEGNQLISFTGVGSPDCQTFPQENASSHLYVYGDSGKLLQQYEAPDNIPVQPGWPNQNLWYETYPPAIGPNGEIAALSSSTLNIGFPDYLPLHKVRALQIFAQGKKIFERQFSLIAQSDEDYNARSTATPPLFTSKGDLFIAIQGKLYHWNKNTNAISAIGPNDGVVKTKNLALMTNTYAKNETPGKKVEEELILFGGFIVRKDGNVVGDLSQLLQRGDGISYGPAAAADVDGDGKMEAISIVYDRNKPDTASIVVWNQANLLFQKTIASKEIFGLGLLRDPMNGKIMILLSTPGLITISGLDGSVDGRFPQRPTQSSVQDPNGINSSFSYTPRVIGLARSLILRSPGHVVPLDAKNGQENLTSPWQIPGINDVACSPKQIGRISCAVVEGSNVSLWKINGQGHLLNPEWGQALADAGNSAALHFIGHSPSFP